MELTDKKTEKIRFIDTTLRDGQQSLWALNMRTQWMLKALPHMDEAGYDGMEFFAPGIQFKKLVHELGEDPWQWLKQGASTARKTRLRLHQIRGQAFSQTPRVVEELFVQKARELGLTAARLSSPWNDFDEMKEDVEDLKRMGIDSVVNLIYSVSPVHTDEYFIKRAKDAAALNPYRICFKDVGGLLKPEITKRLLPKVLSVTGDIPLEFHAHSNNGLVLSNVIEAVKCGVKYIHTAIPPLAYGSSQPSIVDVVKEIQTLGYETDINLSILKAVTEHFTGIAEKENLPIGKLQEYDESIYFHQIPGGMMGTLRFHLKQIGMEDRLDEVLEEVVKVRADFGYPIMVTPISQFVGTQASFNIITGERYKQVNDQIIYYAMGRWGKEAVKVMDQNVRAKILDRPRTKQLPNWENEDMLLKQLTLKEVRNKFGEDLTDEELILATFVDEEAVKIVRQLK